MFTPPDRLVGTHVYVVVAQSLALRNHLAVRDVLRGRPDLCVEYANAKHAAAASVLDIDDYVRRKSGVLQKVLRAAGLSDADLDNVAEQNQ